MSLEEEISQLHSEREELLAEIDAATSDANTNIESLTAEKVSMTYTFLPIISFDINHPELMIIIICILL